MFKKEKRKKKKEKEKEMSAFESVFNGDGAVVVGDGGLGTMLQRAGLKQGDVPESWNLTHPAEVQHIHEEYIRAGSQVIETNTFGCNALRLSDDLKERSEELARAGAEICRRAVSSAAASSEGGKRVLVAGSIGPTGKLPQPLGDLSEEAARKVFCAQARGLLRGGVDFVLIETMTALEEAEFAIKGVLDAAAGEDVGVKAEDVRICVTMSFTVNKRRGLVRTPMGVSPDQLAEMCAKYPQVFCVGHNCGNGLAEAEKIAGELVKAAKKVGEKREGEKKLMVAMQCNAGLPKLGADGSTVYDSDEGDFVKYFEAMKSLGVSYVGGCCGSRPEHIKAITK